MICGQLKTDHKMTELGMDGVKVLKELELVEKKEPICFSESAFCTEHINPTLNRTKHTFWFILF